jgi:HlyD family secretion protein
VESNQAKVGDTVTSDQLLATLAPDSFSKEITLAEADLVTAQQELDKLTNSISHLAEAMQKLADAKQAVQDAEDTLDFYERTSTGRVSEELLKDYQDQIKKAKDQLKMMNWVLDKFYKKTDDDLRRKADFNVVITTSKQSLADLIAKYNWYTGRPSALLMGQTRAALNLAQAKQEDAQRELDRLTNGNDAEDILAARAKVAAAQATLDQSKIIAPFSGTITQAEPQAGDRVSTGQTAFQLDDLSELIFDLQISEVDINNVTVDQPVNITFDAVPNKNYHGIVVKVNQTADVGEGAANYTVVVKMTDADEQVKPGMTAAVTITVKDIQNALLVPNRAVRLVAGKREVYVLKAGQAVAVTIRLGATADAYSEVVGGDLKENDQIILNPPTVASPTP